MNSIPAALRAAVAARALLIYGPYDYQDPQIKKINERRHNRIETALCVGERRGWELCAEEFLQAAALPPSDPEGLRPGVAQAFFDNCPHQEMVRALKRAVGEDTTLRLVSNGKGKK